MKYTVSDVRIQFDALKKNLTDLGLDVSDLRLREGNAHLGYEMYRLGESGFGHENPTYGISWLPSTLGESTRDAWRQLYGINRGLSFAVSHLFETSSVEAAK